MAFTPLSHNVPQRPAAFQNVPRQSRFVSLRATGERPVPLVVVLPRCQASACDAYCTCGGSLLAVFAGRYAHTDFCPDCRTADRPCAGGHSGCVDPEPVSCVHALEWGHCDRPARPGVACATSRNRCCGCCWMY